MALFMNKARLPKFEPRCWQNSISKPLTFTGVNRENCRQIQKRGRMSVKAGQSGHNIAEKSRKGPGARYYRFAAAEAEHVGGFVYAPGRNNFEATRQIDDIGRSAGRNRLRKNHLAR
jgi:hypothetical protein